MMGRGLIQAGVPAASGSPLNFVPLGAIAHFRPAHARNSLSLQDISCRYVNFLSPRAREYACSGLYWSTGPATPGRAAAQSSGFTSTWYRDNFVRPVDLPMRRLTISV